MGILWIHFKNSFEELISKVLSFYSNVELISKVLSFYSNVRKLETCRSDLDLGRMLLIKAECYLSNNWIMLYPTLTPLQIIFVECESKYDILLQAFLDRMIENCLND